MNSQVVAIDQAVRSKNAFYLITVLVPLTLFLNAGFTSVAVIWFFALSLYNLKVSIAHQLKASFVLMLPVAYFTLHLVSALFSQNLTLGLDFLLKEIHLFLIPLAFIVADKRVSEKQVQTVLAFFSAACLLCSFVCLASAIWDVLRTGSFVENASGGTKYYITYLNLSEPVDIPPTYLALFCTWAFFIVLVSPYLGPVLKVCLAVYMAAFIFLLSSTVGVLCLMLVSALWLVLSGNGRWWQYVFAVALLSVVAIALINRSSFDEVLFFDKNEEYGDLVNSVFTRWEIWSYAWETIMNSPLVGHGFGGGQSALEETYREAGFEWGVRQSLNAHNEFLSAALDFGVVGVVVLTATLLIPLMISIKCGSRPALGFIVLMIIFFCFESVLLRQKGIVFFAFFYSILFSHLARSQGESPSA